MNKVKFIAMLSISIFTTLHIFAQGNLVPTSAPASTMKTLQQVEPRVDTMTLAGDASANIIINESGSYYLSDNLSVTKLIGILINASDVTLDLNGFNLLRDAGAGGVGIQIEEESYRATLRNGTINGSFWVGINSPDSEGGRFEHLAIANTLSYAFNTGAGSQIFNSSAHDNQGYGINTAQASIIRDCTVYNNQQTAIQAGDGSVLTRCTAYQNSGTNIIEAGVAILNDCIAYDNQCELAVIYAFSGSTLNRCIVKNNQATYAIDVGQAAALNECIVNDNDANYGIRVSTDSLMNRCAVRSTRGNSSSHYGIYASFNCSIIQSTVANSYSTNISTTSSQGVGIRTDSGSTIKNCSLSLNTGDGILVTSECLIMGNNIVASGIGSGDGAGIHVTGYNNRIENNHVLSNDRGIDVDIGGNMIVRNSASNNSTNYTIVAANKVGTIVQAPDSTVISGSTGGAGMGSIDPWANFSF